MPQVRLRLVESAGAGRAQGLRDRLESQWADGVAADRSQDDRVLERAIAAGLERLSLTQRQVLVLRFYAALSVRDIAVVLNLPEGTVKRRLYGAVLAMRELPRAGAAVFTLLERGLRMLGEDVTATP